MHGTTIKNEPNYSSKKLFIKRSLYLIQNEEQGPLLQTLAIVHKTSFFICSESFQINSMQLYLCIFLRRDYQ